MSTATNKVEIEPAAFHSPFTLHSSQLLSALRWENLDEDITVPGVVAGHFELPLDPTP